MLLFYPKYIVGFKKGESFNTESFPLAFMTYISNDKSYETRKDSVLGWISSYYDKSDSNPEVRIHEFDNIPVEGFEFYQIVSRYSTSNKLFEIRDPRGFRVQIYTDNVLYLMENGIIDHGRLLGKYVWGRTKSGANFLVSEKNNDYLESLKPKTKQTLEVGDVMVTRNGSKYVYDGKYYILGYNTNPKQVYGSWRDPFGKYKEPEYTYHPSLTVVDKQVLVFHDEISCHLRQSLPKLYTIESKNNSINTFESLVGVYQGYGSTVNFRYDFIFLYKTKEEMMEAYSKIMTVLPQLPKISADSYEAYRGRNYKDKPTMNLKGILT